MTRRAFLGMTTEINKKRDEVNNLYDITIIGGGLAGLSTACLLANRTDYKIALIDNGPRAPKADGRTTAISWGSHNVLSHAGVWEKLAANASAIEIIHIMDGEDPHKLIFDVSETDRTAFGWIVDNPELRRTMIETLEDADNVDLYFETALNNIEGEQTLHTSQGVFKTKLLIGADGRNSAVRNLLGITTRGWSYDQHALVCIIEHENPHNQIAVEHFHAAGPFAALPLNDNADGKHRSSLVWSIHGPREEAEKWMNCDETLFNTALENRFPDFYGQPKLGSPRNIFPLGLQHAHVYTAPRTILIAEAAHVMHPIAGQGLNISLRDSAALADLLSGHNNDPGDSDIISQYQKMRRADTMAMMGSTDQLNRLFSNNNPVLKLARRTGLRAVSRIGPARKFFMHQAMGTAGYLPALVQDATS